MPVADTSILTYNDIKPTLGIKRKAILDIINYLGNCTNSEIHNFSGIPINEVTGRVHELVDDRFVIFDCKRECKITKRTVKSWRAI